MAALRAIGFAPPSNAAETSNLHLTGCVFLLCCVCCLTSSAYQEWLRGQALRRHSNLVQLPRC
jgi:hypothetical protein